MYSKVPDDGMHGRTLVWAACNTQSTNQKMEQPTYMYYESLSDHAREGNYLLAHKLCSDHLPEHI